MSISNNENKELNPFEKQMAEINEYQSNSANPGYYIGSGKVPTYAKNSIKSPILTLIIGIIFGIFAFLSLKNDLSFENIMNNIITILISSAFIFGGIYRLIKKY